VHRVSQRPVQPFTFHLSPFTSSPFTGVKKPYWFRLTSRGISDTPKENTLIDSRQILLTRPVPCKQGGRIYSFIGVKDSIKTCSPHTASTLQPGRAVGETSHAFVTRAVHRLPKSAFHLSPFTFHIFTFTRVKAVPAPVAHF